jgi:hypothetical protein
MTFMFLTGGWAAFLAFGVSGLGVTGYLVLRWRGQVVNGALLSVVAGVAVSAIIVGVAGGHLIMEWLEGGDGEQTVGGPTTTTPRPTTGNGGTTRWPSSSIAPGAPEFFEAVPLRRLVLEDAQRADLNKDITGPQGLPGADFGYWHEGGKNILGAIPGGSRLAPTSTSTQPELSGCQEILDNQSKGTYDLSNNVFDGLWFCVMTNEGNVAVLQVPTHLPNSGGPITIDYVVWKR